LGIEAAHAKLQDIKAEALGALTPFRPHEAMLAGAAEFVVARKF
jgi:farnesyl diphosphate synthase